MSTTARLTLDEYDRMIERDVFERDRRIELIYGELREMSLIGDPHRDAVNALTNYWPLASVSRPAGSTYCVGSFHVWL